MKSTMKNNSNLPLFAPQAESLSEAPLAHRLRPSNLLGFKGHEELFLRYPFLKSNRLPSLILHGPPGSGKTTLAYLLAQESGLELYKFNAVLGGIPELKKIIASATEMKGFHQIRPAIFIDEIHRFNKAQQDALLPYVEEGSFVLIGATTENPKSSINGALLSRLQLVRLNQLSLESITEMIDETSAKINFKLSPDLTHFLASRSGGDARKVMNVLDLIDRLSSSSKLSDVEIKKIILDNARRFDKDGDRHYDIISAFIKSMRGSDPDAALLYLAVMLDGGEDPAFIARRLMIFASEDVGNSDPMALLIASAAFTAVSNIGMPEARINLAQAVTYLASTTKSNAAYNGINEAMEFVENHGTIDTPDRLKNYPPKGTTPYLYPHDYPEHFVVQKYTREKIPTFYRPGEIGHEKKIKERLERLWNLKNR